MTEIDNVVPITEQELDRRISSVRNEATARTYEQAANIVLDIAAKHFVCGGLDDVARALREAGNRLQEEAKIFRK